MMKISAVKNYIHFSGEQIEPKKNKLKTAAQTAAMALATAIPAQEADAQFIYPYYHPAVVVNVPDCFIAGNMYNPDINKNMKEVFNEIDINENDAISAGEVINTEKNNWNKYSIYPYTTTQAIITKNQFEVLSALYNEDGSNPETINFREYRTIMKDYMINKNINNFYNLMQFLALPPCPPPHHHHDRHHRR